jgi:D-alanyl-D-alanine carboxypeptidase
MRATYDNDWVRDVMQITSSKISMSSGTSEEEENRNKLIGKTLDENLLTELGVSLNGNNASNAICVGGKTGYTTKAGRCLAAMFEKDGRLLVGVVLKSVYKNENNEDLDVFKDMASIINWSYNTEKVTYQNNDTSYIANSQITSIDVAFKPLLFVGPNKIIQVPLTVKEDVQYYENAINDKEITENIELEDINPWKLKDDVSIGTLAINQREATTSYELYPMLTTSNLVFMSKFTYLLAVIALIFILLLIRILLVSSSRRKRRKRSRGNKYHY